MTDIYPKDPKKEREHDKGFTGMPNQEFPNFEPEQCSKKQMEQFEATANNQKDEYFL